jgi:predicted ArsR family transcriptional regulator
MKGWWNEIDQELLACLSCHGAMTPEDLGRHLGVSEDAAVSLLAMLARDGQVRIRLVEVARPTRALVDTRAA